MVSAHEVERIRDLGARVVVGGDRYADAFEAAARHRERTGELFVHAYDGEEVLAGQGTVAREMEQQAPDLDTVLVAVGGGGLVGGIASWYAGRVKVVAVEPERAPTLHAALSAGGPVDVEVSGLAAGGTHRPVARAAPGQRGRRCRRDGGVGLRGVPARTR